MTYKELKEAVLPLVYDGIITVGSLSVELFKYTYFKLRAGIDKFFPTEDFENPDFMVKVKLAQNVYLFSGAKTYKNIWDLQKLIVDDKGFKRSFDEFYNLASKVFDQYNVNWLKTEFETAYTSAKQAAHWQRIIKDKDHMPYLKYVTAGDERVRPSHAALDGIVKKVTDPFWNTFYPPNGFNCRCIVIQLDEAEETSLTKTEIEQLTNDVDPLFRMNSGKHEYIFSSKHKYFNANTLPPKLRDHFKVERSRNFGFKVPLFMKKD